MSAITPEEVDLALLRTALRGLALFAGVDDDTIAQLADGTQLVRLAPGETLFDEGDPPDGMAVVLGGRLRLTRVDASGRPRHIADVGRGDMVGEMGVLSDQPRSATATATRDTTVAALGTKLVRDVVLQRPESLLTLARTLVTRIDRGERHHWSPVRTIAVLPAGSTPPETARLVLDELAAALSRHGSTVVLADHDAASLGKDDRAVGTDGLIPASVRAWLDRVEQAHDHVLLDGTAATEWTGWCLRFADAILVVADAGADPIPNAVEQALWAADESPHVEIVLVHEPSTKRPRNTARWLARRRPAARHHVRRGHAGDHARLARLVTGRGIGLVLGGGGPRGFAHLGVMQALDEAGIPVDLVGGTSIGSIMGAYLAMGLDHDQRVKTAVTAFGDPDLIRYTLPLVSLSSSRGVTTGLRSKRNFADLQIEDLWRRYLCVSVDLVTGEEVVHERGPVWLATRASVSLPAVFPPVVDGERILVDGGILNNVPVDHVANRLAGGTIIAVDLEYRSEVPRIQAPVPPDLSGWRVLADRLVPWRTTPHLPGPIETLLRSRSAIATRVQQDVFRSTPPDLLIKPRLGPHGFIDFRSAPRFIQPGYEAAVQALEQAPLSLPARGGVRGGGPGWPPATARGCCECRPPRGRVRRRAAHCW